MQGDLVPLLLVGSADGMLHVWRGAYQSETLELVTAFRALSDLAFAPGLSTGALSVAENSVTNFANVGLIVDWISDQRLLLVSGEVKDGVIRAWDLERELHVQNISSQYASNLTNTCSIFSHAFYPV